MSQKDKPLPTVSVKQPIWKNIGPRAVSGLLFSALGIPPIFFAGYLWAVLLLVVGLRLTFEWVRMTDPNKDRMALIIPMAGLTIAVGYVIGGYNLLSFLTITITAVIAGLQRKRRGGVLWSGLGSLYIAIPTVLMIALRGHEAGLTEGFYVILFLILVVVGADMGAYFGGSAIKGPRIAPKISPNKTWAGFVSGLIAGCIVALIAGYVMGLETEFSILLAVPIIIFSVIGDFFESGVKRHFNVKDTGRLMPGHGGLLDRFDGLMLSVIAIAAMLWAVPSLWPGLL